ncbi:hypothetical protein SDJN02_07564, partial [Cucurbita argyrosperma subsp. argyrosperma]
MARQFVVLALVLFAIVGFATAASPSESPKGSANNTDVGDLLAPGADKEIGNTDGGDATNGSDDVVEGPIGGPGVPGGESVPAEAPKSAMKVPRQPSSWSAAAGAGCSNVVVQKCLLKMQQP